MPDEKKDIDAIAHAAVARREAEELVAAERALNFPRELVLRAEVDADRRALEQESAIGHDVGAAEKVAKEMESAQGFAGVSGGIGQEIAKSIRADISEVNEFKLAAQAFVQALRSLPDPSSSQTPAAKPASTAKTPSK
jgi:hypothetical protein